MDVEGSLSPEDYVPSQGEKQIAPKPPKYPKYEMDPRYWQIDPGVPPPDYDEIDDEPLAIEAPPDEGDKDDKELEGEEDEREANKILDYLEFPNYDEVEKKLTEPEMIATRQKHYLDNVIKNAKTRRSQIIAM